MKEREKIVEHKNSKREYNEVLALLELIPSYDYLKIPSSKINILKKNSNKEYNFHIENLEDAKISPKAYAIFIKLYQEYIATDKEKEKLDEILKINDKIKKEKYDIVFKESCKNEAIPKEQAMIVKKTSFLEKILYKIRKYFRRN